MNIKLKLEDAIMVFLSKLSLSNIRNWGPRRPINKSPNTIAVFEGRVKSHLTLRAAIIIILTKHLDILGDFVLYTNITYENIMPEIQYFQ